MSAINAAVARALAAFAFGFAAPAWAGAEPLPDAFVSRSGEIVALIDRNADGDFLDTAERLIWCGGLPAAIGAIAISGDSVFVVRADTPAVLRITDLNGDGDALDTGEVSLFAQLSTDPPAPALTAIVAQADGALLVADAANGRVILLRDLNGDSDALDFAEALVVTEGLTSPVALAVRPDGCVLVAQNLSAVPVRILCDRNGDGNFLGFAENISYAENAAPGAGLCATSDVLSYLARPAAGEVALLRDLNGDGDALDIGEIVQFAAPIAAATRLACDGGGSMLLVAADAAGTVYRVRDRNGDGDAMDAGEVLVVAAGLTSAGGIAVRSDSSPPVCLRGDMNADGQVTLADAVPLASALLAPAGAEFCRADVNADGQIDGRDIASFVDILVP